MMFERVDQIYPEKVEIILVSSDLFACVHAKCCGNHGILQQMIGFALHNPRPHSKANCLHREYVVRCTTIQSFGFVLKSHSFNTYRRLTGISMPGPRVTSQK